MSPSVHRLGPLIALLGSFMAPAEVPALTLTSNAAGFAAIPTFNCETDSNVFEIEVLFNTGAPCYRHGIVEFGLAGTGVTAVSSATLTLRDGNVGNMEGSFFTVDFYGYAGDGLVTGADYDVGTYIGSATWSRYGLPLGEFAIDITNYVNDQLLLGTEFVGLSIRAPLQTSNCCTTSFLYFDGGTGDHPPTLTLEPVPVPAAAWCFGSALGLLGWARRPSAAGTRSSTN